MATAAARERLRHAVAASVRDRERARPAPEEAGRPPLAEILRGDWHETRDGPVFVRDEWFPADHQHGRLELGRALQLPGDILGRLARADGTLRGARLAYFDIETTGLGGSGTYVVLAGVGTFESPGDGLAAGFRLRQYFLADVRHERAMLSMLAEDLGRADALVTYNGRAFDVPFLQARLTMTRVVQGGIGAAHIDLLHTVRRLYKHRMPGCRLAEAERRILRLERPDDIPGWLIPSLYFDYARAGRVAPLRPVFRHNADDVLSMAGVLSHVCALIDGRAPDAADIVAVARWWEHEGEAGKAAALYATALPWLEGGEDWAWAASRYAALCRRSGAHDEAAGLSRGLWERGDREAGLQLAKYLEHKARDHEGALAVVTELMAGAVTKAESERLGHRLARLRRKSHNV